MESALFTKKIRKYGIISFLVPLITINACFLIFNFLGSVTLYTNINWSEKKIELSFDEYTRKLSNTTNYGALNCPKYEYDKVYISHDNQKFRLPFQHVYKVDSGTSEKFYLLKKFS